MGRNSTETTEVEEFLSHYGVKGMKWGVRRSAKQLATTAKGYVDSEKKARAATSRTRFVSGNKDAPKNLTDKELETRIKRMETEKKYNELNAKTVSKGQQHINEVITNVGKKSVGTAGAGLALYGIKKLVEKKMSPEAAAAIPKLKK